MISLKSLQRITPAASLEMCHMHVCLYISTQSLDALYQFGDKAA